MNAVQKLMDSVLISAPHVQGKVFEVFVSWRHSVLLDRSELRRQNPQQCAIVDCMIHLDKYIITSVVHRQNNISDPRFAKTEAFLLDTLDDLRTMILVYAVRLRDLNTRLLQDDADPLISSLIFDPIQKVRRISLIRVSPATASTHFLTTVDPASGLMFTINQ